VHKDADARPLRVLLLVGIVGLAILAMDLIMPQVVAGGIPYVIFILLSVWFPWRYIPVVMALLGTVFSVVSHLMEDPGLVGGRIGIEILVLWATAYLVIRHRAAQQALMNPEGRLRALVITAADGVIIIDSMGMVQEFNPACEKMFGYPADEVIGHNVNILMPSPYHDEHDGYLARYRERQERRIIGIGREIEGLRRDGSTFPIELSVGEAHYGDEQSFVGIIRDITARKAAEEALRAAKRQAESASQAKSLFVANMSHEIRTPLNAVLGYTQIMQNDPAFPERHRQALQAIDRAGNHLLGVINQILDLSKIEAGAMELDIQGFDLHELIDALSALFKSRCEQQGMVWQVESRIDQRMVRGDQGKLRQVLINLLGNAAKFTDLGRICLSVTQTGDSCRFAVEDTGSGMTPEACERIFEPFQQGDEGIRKGGTGLGLTLSKRHIELMGGRLEVSSQIGQGSQFTFEVTLPPAEGPVVSASLTGKRILRLAQDCRVSALVVDDVADNRELLKRMLETVGVNVSSARNGKKALEEILISPPDIVFMDVRMPIMDGLDALCRIKKQVSGQRIVCVAMSATGWRHEIKHYLEVGFDAFIAKPYRFETVCECIEKHLGVRFEHTTAGAGLIDNRDLPLDLSRITLSAPLRQRLLDAARSNAFTEIEAALIELKAMDEWELVEHLQKLLAHYDSRAIVATIEGLGLPRDQNTPPATARTWERQP